MTPKMRATTAGASPCSVKATARCRRHSNSAADPLGLILLFYALASPIVSLERSDAVRATDLGTITTVLNVNVTGTTYTPGSATFVPGDNYQWQVQVVPAVAGLCDTQPPVGFSIVPVIPPNSISPTSFVQTTTTPTFSWTATPGAAYYQLTVLDQSEQNSVALTVPQVTGTTYTPTTPLINGHDYQWYVQAYVLYNGIPYPSQASAPLVFSIAPAGATTLLSPSIGATLTTATPTFQWSAVAGAALYGMTVIDLTTGANVINDSHLTTLTSYNLGVPLPTGHLYEWSVQVPGVSNSPTAEFTIAVPGAQTGNLVTPTLLGPTRLVNTTTPTFQWQPIPGATGYSLYVFSENPIGSITSSVFPPVQTSNTSFTPATGFLSPSGAYLWWVTADDNAGDVSLSPKPLDFGVAEETGPVGTPIPLSPSGTITTFNPTLQWVPVANAFSYGVTVIDQTLGTVADMRRLSELPSTSAVPHQLSRPSSRR